MAIEKQSQEIDDVAIEATGQGDFALDDEALEIGSTEADNTDDDDDTDDVEVDGDDTDDEEAEEVDSDDDTDDDTDDQQDDEAEEPSESTRFESVSELSADDDVQFMIEYHDEKRRETELDFKNAKEAESSFLKKIGLKHFPYTLEGRSLNVYTMSDMEFDNFIDRLEQHEEVRRSDVREVIRAREKYAVCLEQAEHNALYNTALIDQAEWELIATRAPEFVAKNEKKIADAIKKKIDSDPILGKRVKTFKGKLSILNQVIKELNLGKKAEKGKKETERLAPNIHKNRSRGKAQRNNAPLQFRTKDEFRRWVRDLDPEEATTGKYAGIIAKYSNKFASKS